MKSYLLVIYSLFLASCVSPSIINSSSTDKYAVVIVDPLYPASQQDIDLSANDHCKKYNSKAVFVKKEQGLMLVKPAYSLFYYECVRNSPPLSLIWPANGRVISEFTEATKGIDIAGNMGQAIVASSDGVVVFSRNTLKGYGNLIIIKHDNTYLTAYAHNRKILVNEGDFVKMGQKIAEMGDSESSSVRLHFEVRIDGKPVNPQPYLTGVNSISTTPASGMTNLDDVKNQCRDLGFKAGTEGFGKCVLQLSK